MEQEPQNATLRGAVERVTFRNPTNGYSVLQVRIEDTSERITVVGTCPHTKVGAHVLMTGSFIAHPKFGRQFTLQSIGEVPPSTAHGIERYLSSGLVTGVGKKTAQRIVKELGTQALEAIRTDPARVAAIEGVGKKKAALLLEALTAQGTYEQTLRFLVEHEISPALSARIYERFRDKTLDIVQADPYILAREIRGIGFNTADSIARKLGIPLDSPLRLRAGLMHALTSASEEGHCFLRHKVLWERAQLLLGIENSAEIGEQLEHLISCNILVARHDGVFLKHFDAAESFVADFLSSRTEPHHRSADSKATLLEALAEAEKSLKITLSAEQRHAAELAAVYPLLIITGGPGCGKTTMIKALTVLFEKAGLAYALAAPTGRAAQRMSQVCGAPASTIHRLLKYDPHSRGFVFNESNTLALDALIIDEASMIDILLARDLFSAIPKRCTLILVGDKDQLPSVGPGRVFGDLIRCGHIPVVQLSQLFRRTAESNINSVAHMINVGEVPSIPTPDGITKSDAYFLEKNEPGEAAQLIESLVAEQIPRKFGFSGPDIAVITPTNRGPLGTVELNKRLQERLNPRSLHSDAEMLEFGDVSFRVGDRVCQRVNNYRIDPSGVFNGDSGTITALDRSEQALTVEMWDGRLIQYQRPDLGQLSLAYAITVHRSQGMEVPCVVLTLDDSHYTLLERQLVYTGITRAKKLLIIVGSKRALAMATRRTQTKKRCTLLVERIRTLVTNGGQDLGVMCPNES
jgi:exodeoxyribonuclease V alpha subunit